MIVSLHATYASAKGTDGLDSVIPTLETTLSDAAIRSWNLNEYIVIKTCNRFELYASTKDVPTSLRNGLTLGAVLARDDPADVILPCRLEELPEGATVGTSSVRRRSLLHYLRPDLKIKNLRGNIQTRLDKLDCDKYDAIILAKAGLDRMGIERSAFRLDPQIFIPAPAQGAIAIECRSDDEHTLNLVSSIDDHITRIETGAEREIMRIVEAGCSSPIGIYAKEENGALRITGVSFADGIEPTRINCLIPMNYTEIDLIAVADSLRGASR